MENKDSDIFEYHKNAMIENAKLAVMECESAHRKLFSIKSQRPEEARNNIILALHYLAVVKSIYYSSPDNEHPDIEEFFSRFEIFVREVLSNIARDHDHQWTDIEFRHLLDIYRYCVIVDPDYSEQVAAILW